MIDLPVKVYALVADPNTEAQVVILKEEQNQTLLPIWVGAAEATTIRLAMEKVPIPRPLTHDLLKDLLTHLHFRMEKAVINDIHNSTYYAAIYLKPEFSSDPKEASTSLQFDARPSDAIALSLRCDAPLYIAEELFRKQDSGDGFLEWLSRTQPKDFGTVTHP